MLDIVSDCSSTSSSPQVRFNPNMNCYTWVASAGQAGLVRLNCLRSMISPQFQKIITKNQAQFNALYTSEDPGEEVQTVTDAL